MPPKKMFFRLFSALILGLFFWGNLFSQENFFATVHFIHGSKPKREFRGIEKKWLGGQVGGHVGIEVSPDRVVDFRPKGRVHFVARQRKIRGKYAIQSLQKFWRYHGTDPADLKRTSIQIPISLAQKNVLDSLAISFVENSPHDYAFLGMRCASTSYALLMQADILKKRSTVGLILKNFYPKKFRRQLEKLALKNNWAVQKTVGTDRRKWDKN